MSIELNAKTYTEDFQFVHQYGQDVLSLIDAPKGSFIIDLGCGNGALTKKLYDMGYDVVGVDASEKMLEIARENYPEITFIKQDAINLHLERKADVIFSNAMIHWIDDFHQDQLLSSIYNQLTPGG